MQSTYFAVDKPAASDILEPKEDLEEVDARGFLIVAAVLFVIYAAAARPVFYAEVGKWISQVF